MGERGNNGVDRPRFLASKRALNDHEREEEDSDMDINQREAAAENEDALSGLRSDILGQ